MNVILASNSPRRRQLLKLTGMDFRVVPTDIDETPLQGEPPIDYVVRLAASKAKLASENQDAGALIIAADTAVISEDKILGKPEDDFEAEKMLRQLRGQTHQVYSGVAVNRGNKSTTDFCITDVPMRPYSDEEIMDYVASGDPLDKAGAYAIQNLSFHPVSGLSECYANVMGLPLCNLANVLRTHGVFLEQDIPVSCQEFTGYKCPIFQDILRTPEYGGSFQPPA